MHIQSTVVGEVVLCKLRGFCEWPATVTAINHGRISVEFFGDRTTHSTTIKNIFSFSANIPLIISNLTGRKNPLFRKSVKEAEAVLGVPEDQRLSNRN